jgi:hypothetical protein
MSEHVEIVKGELCRNCNALLHGPYCSQCGQAAADGHAPTVGHFFHDLTHEILHVDGKIFRTLKALLFEPGRLTSEYWSGRVVAWIRPIRLFLIIAALHAVLSPGLGPVNYRVWMERNAKGDVSVFAQGSLSRARDQRGKAEDRARVTEAEQIEYEHHFHTVYSSIRYFALVGFAFATWLIYRKRVPFFMRHLIGALYFYSMMYLVAGVAGALLLRLAPGRVVGGVAGALVMGTAFLYLLFMLKRLFQERWLPTVLKTCLLGGAFLLIELLLGVASSTVAARFIH